MYFNNEKSMYIYDVYSIILVFFQWCITKNTLQIDLFNEEANFVTLLLPNKEQLKWARQKLRLNALAYYIKL